MERLTFETLQSHPELIHAIVTRARRERSKAMGTFIAQAFRRRRAPCGAPGEAASTRRGQVIAGPAMYDVRRAGQGDRERVQALVRGLSPRSRYLRFFSGIRELTPQWLDRFTRGGSESDLTLLALARTDGEEIPVGMAQYAASPHHARGEFAVVVADDWQGMGIGTRLIRHVVCLAQDAGSTQLECEVLAENRAMLRLARGLGFEVERNPETPISLRASLPLSAARSHCAELLQSGVAIPAMQA